jgi:hypothetical protein
MGDEGKGKIVDVLTSKYDISSFSKVDKCWTHLEFDGIKRLEPFLQEFFIKLL